MKYIIDDRFNIKLSKIGLGTGRFGTKIPLELAFEMLRIFSLAGGTVVDTARNYYEWVEGGRGKSEETLGKWFEKTGLRDKICIFTADVPGLLVHQRCKTLHTASDLFCDSYRRVVVGLQHQGIQQIF